MPNGFLWLVLGICVLLMIGALRAVVVHNDPWATVIITVAAGLSFVLMVSAVMSLY
jgi:hypothetical protein